MRVLIGTFVLAEGLRDSVEDLSVGAEDLIQVSPLVDAAHPAVENMENTTTRVSFAKTRTHADFLTAERFLLEHLLEIPKTGLITFVCESGGTEAALYMPNGTCHARAGRHIGVTTIHQYTITGGALTRIRPSS